MSSIVSSSVLDFEEKEVASASIPLFIISCLILFLAIGFRIWVQSQCTQLGYKIADLMQAEVEYDMSIRELELQKSVLLRPDYLEKRAKDLFGLSNMKPDQARVLSLN